jgi:glyoxylase-like metal-dependent hydrolase (beta-lactamase superfamily II)/rhodanese-related sulfurtransferase
MIFRQLFDSDTSTYTYLLADNDTRQAVLIDPVMEQVDRDLRLLRELNLTLIYCLDTHVHADHVTAAGTLRERTGCLTGVSSAAGVACADRPMQGGDSIEFGRHRIEVVATPGHTSGCLTYVVNHNDQTYAFTGDAIFVRGCGRTDFQQGDARTLYRSVHEGIFALSDDTLVYPGHDYNGHRHTTVGEEKAHNPRLNTTISEDEFVAIMENLKLGMPKKIDVAVPANLGCGVSSEADQNQEQWVPEVAPSQVGELSAWRLIDVREPHEWVGELGCIEVAEKIPKDQIVEAAADWDKSDRLLIVCRSGKRSWNSASALLALGFTDVSNLTGGMIAWNAARSEGVVQS